MRYLSESTRAADRVAVIQNNFELLEVAAFEHRPTDDNAIVGPPVAGEYLLHEKWIDSLGAVFRCITAGGAGTFAFRQIGEPVVADTTERDAIASPPTGYRVITDDDGVRHRWDGAAWAAI